MAEVVDNMNVRHINAQMAGRASTELHTLVFFRGKETLADARVVKVQANGLQVCVHSSVVLLGGVRGHVPCCIWPRTSASHMCPNSDIEGPTGPFGTCCVHRPVERKQCMSGT